MEKIGKNDWLKTIFNYVWCFGTHFSFIFNDKFEHIYDRFKTYIFMQSTNLRILKLSEHRRKNSKNLQICPVTKKVCDVVSAYFLFKSIKNGRLDKTFDWLIDWLILLRWIADLPRVYPDSRLKSVGKAPAPPRQWWIRIIDNGWMDALLHLICWLFSIRLLSELC